MKTSLTQSFHNDSAKIKLYAEMCNKYQRFLLHLYKDLCHQLTSPVQNICTPPPLVQNGYTPGVFVQEMRRVCVQEKAGF